MHRLRASRRQYSQRGDLESTEVHSARSRTRADAALIAQLWEATLPAHELVPRLGLDSVEEAHYGAITFIQRSDSALRLNPHLNVLALDGVYVRGDANELVFQSLAPPSLEEIFDVADRTAIRMLRHLDDNDHDSLRDDEPLLAHLYSASTEGRSLSDQRPIVRVIDTSRIQPAREGALRVEARGFGLHAGVTVGAHDRQRRLHLCRYLARPPLAQDRLAQRSDGKLILCFKKPWRDGTTAVVLSPFDLIARLCALVPPPRFHLLLSAMTRRNFRCWASALATVMTPRSRTSPRKPPERNGPRSSPASFASTLPFVPRAADRCPSSALSPTRTRPSALSPTCRDRLLSPS